MYLKWRIQTSAGMQARCLTAPSMTSSRRSSARSSRSYSPFIWRSKSTASNTTPPSVTVIVAEPEQGSPLASAIGSLPVKEYKTANLLGSNEMPLVDVNHDTSKPKSAVALELSGGTSKIATAAESDHDSSDTPSTPATKNRSNDQSTDDQQRPTKDSLSSLPMERSTTGSSSTVTQAVSNIQSPSGSKDVTSFWFGSLSRSKGKEKLPLSNGFTQAQLPNDQNPINSPKEGPLIATTETSIIITSDPLPDPNGIESQNPPSHREIDSTDVPLSPGPPVKLAPQTRRWFASSNSASATHLPIPTGLPNPVQSPLISTPSSIDDVVPELQSSDLASISPTAGSAPLVSSHVLDQANYNTNPSSLDMPTNRFTISIPFLRRPKMPLDQVVALARAGVSDKRNNSSAAGESKPRLSLL